jgi:hypothetical protein
MRKHYLIAASRFEGCGHRHKTIAAAVKCLPRIENRGKTKGVYLMPKGYRLTDAKGTVLIHYYELAEK